MAYNNVIIFGAGASVDAGIPLLSNFVDTMWNLAIRERSNSGPLSPNDLDLFKKANTIRVELERFNSRANFRLRNLEDVLSLLSFEAMSGTDSKAKYETWVKAITRTIELTTKFPPPDGSRPLDDAINYKRTLYHAFWDSILGQDTPTDPPAIITFNYDLVLERALWDYFHCIVTEDGFKPAKDSCKITYFLKPYDFTIRANKCFYTVNRLETAAEAGYISNRMLSVRHDGIKPSIEYNQNGTIEIPYLKLHGSLNWCDKSTPNQTDPISDTLIPSTRAIDAAESPLILPPVFNKMNSGKVVPVWAKALEILRQAKHIIFVGYSLPKTDIYMQYFLKSAVGPNSSLQKIIVFDPALFSEANNEMRQRFQECFSPQFQEQITFMPEMVGNAHSSRGTFAHFVGNLASGQGDLLF